MPNTQAQQSQDMETVKKIVRALLTSSKHGLTERQLLRDYKTVTGEELDYHVLGFSTPKELFRAMPDAVGMKLASDNYTCILYGRSGGNADVERVASLVARQKSGKKTYTTFKSSKPLPPAIPPPFKVKLRTLMFSYPNGIYLEQFPEAFARRFGYYVNVNQWGFSDVQSALKTASDIVKLEFDEHRNQYKINCCPRAPKSEWHNLSLFTLSSACASHFRWTHPYLTGHAMSVSTGGAIVQQQEQQQQECKEQISMNSIESDFSHVSKKEVSEKLPTTPQRVPVTLVKQIQEVTPLLTVLPAIGCTSKEYSILLYFYVWLEMFVRI